MESSVRMALGGGKGGQGVTGAEAAFAGRIVRCHCPGNLRDFTLEETDTHKRNCELGKLNKRGGC